MNKNTLYFSAVIAAVMLLTTSSCKNNKQGTGTAETPTELVDTVAEKTVSDTLTNEMEQEDDSDEIKQEDESDEGYPLTSEQPKGKILQLLKDYNAHMEDYNTTSVMALGMGFQRNYVLVNYSVADISFDLKNKAKLKTQVRKLILSMPISEIVAWRCIPDEGHDLIVTLVGRQSSKIVSVVFTKKELKEILY